MPAPLALTAAGTDVAPAGPVVDGASGNGSATAATPTESARNPAVSTHSTAPPAPQAEATASSAPERMSTEAITAALLEVVSTRTGYPTDMLGLDADLEADLGIDSIKRVEIAGLVMRALPLPESAGREIEKVTASRTLRQVIEVLEGLLTPVGAAATPERPPFAVEPVGEGHTGRLVTQLSAAPDSSPPATLAAGAVVLVAGPASNPVADALADELRARRLTVAIASAPLAELADPAVADAFVASVRATSGRVVALLHLGALSPTDNEYVLRSMFALVKAAQPDLEAAADAGGAAVLAVHPTEPTGAGWVSGGLLGFCRTLALEEPDVRVRAVAVDLSDQPADLATAVLAELNSSDPAVVMSAGGLAGRRIPVSVPKPTGGRQSCAALPDDAVVLLTGGARGITAEAALALAEEYRPTLVLAGRTALSDEPVGTAGIEDRAVLRATMTAQLRAGSTAVTPATVERAVADLLAGREVRSTLSRLRAAGARVEYVSCDVRDATAFAAVIDDVYSRHGRIDAVVHGAGIIEDKLVATKTADSFGRVIETKLSPARVLAERLRPSELRFLVFFSSVAARVGNRGQCDYAAANSALDVLAHVLDASWPGRVVSIGWGPWATGMVSPELAREFASRGVPLLSAAEGRRAFLEELTRGRKGEVEVLVTAVRGESSQPTASLAPTSVPQTSPPLLSVGTLRRSAQPDRLTLTRTFDLRSDPCLDDHRIDDRPVVPFAYVLELVCEAAGGAAAQGGGSQCRADAPGHRNRSGRWASRRQRGRSAPR